eukprot:Em0100g7a
MESWTTGLSVETVIMEPFPTTSGLKWRPRQKKKKRWHRPTPRVCYGQVKKLRWDDDDSIVKHKLATMAVRDRQTRSTSRQDPQHQPPGPAAPAARTRSTSRQDPQHQPPGPAAQPPGPAAPAARTRAPAARTRSTSRQDPQHQPPGPAAPAARTRSTSRQDRSTSRQDPHQPPGPAAPAARTRSTSRQDPQHQPQDRSTSRQDPQHHPPLPSSPSSITLITILHYPHHHPPLPSIITSIISSPFHPTLTLITTLTPTLITMCTGSSTNSSQGELVILQSTSYSTVHPQVHTRTRATRYYTHSNEYKSWYPNMRRSGYTQLGIHLPTTLN